MQKKQLEILDCTIRDGGYVNDWDFSNRLVKDVYRNLSRAGVDIVEIGFRAESSPNSAVWQSLSEEVINELFVDLSGAKIALLINYGAVGLADIPEAKNSLVKMYRVACNKDKVLETIDFCNGLKKKGYLVSIQLMGIVSYSEEELVQIGKPLQDSSIDYIYFADSYGSLFPKDIKKYTDHLKPLNKKIGFHPHNGLQLAFANTLEAISCGVDIVDGTVYGMGRGAGNLPIEVLIIYLEKMLSHERYNSIPVLDLIDRYFISIKKEIPWGYCLPYMLSGIFEVHPYYSKFLTDAHEYSVDDMVKALEIVRNLKPIGFDKGLIKEVVLNGFSKPEDEKEEKVHDIQEIQILKKKYRIDYVNRHPQRDFLILANGPMLREHKKNIDQFISKYNPIVIGVNFIGNLFVPDYHAFSNKKRFMNYVGQANVNSKLLLSSNFEEEFINEYTQKDYEIIVHLNRVSSIFEIKENIITSNCRTVSILMIAVAIVMGAKRIFIAGMDGYKKEQGFVAGSTHFYPETEESENVKDIIEKHDWNEKLLHSINHYLQLKDREALHILTPTAHKFFYNSIYNWI